MQIQEHEAPYLVDLVQQAQANLAPQTSAVLSPSRIAKLVIDRAYVDGPSLYQLHALGTPALHLRFVQVQVSLSW